MEKWNHMRLDWVRKGLLDFSMCVEIRITCDVWARYIIECVDMKNQTMNKCNFAVPLSRMARYNGNDSKCECTMCFALFLFRRFSVVAVACIFHFQRTPIPFLLPELCERAHNKHWFVRLSVYYKFVRSVYEHEHSRFGERALFIICNHQPQIDACCCLHVLFIRFIFS